MKRGSVSVVAAIIGLAASAIGLTALLTGLTGSVAERTAWTIPAIPTLTAPSPVGTPVATAAPVSVALAGGGSLDAGTTVPGRAPTASPRTTRRPRATTTATTDPGVGGSDPTQPTTSVTTLPSGPTLTLGDTTADRLTGS